VTRALLVADEDVAQLLGREQRVVDRQDRAARQPEDVGDAEQLERADDRLRPRDELGLGASGRVLVDGSGVVGEDIGVPLTRVGSARAALSR
jgi:hypothetical protein